MNLYFNNIASTLVTTSKQMSTVFGTAISTSTTAAPTTNKTVQFIPGTTNNNTAFTPTANVYDNKGWLYDKQLTGRFYPGNFTVNITVNNNNAANTGQIVAQVGIVNVVSNAVVLIAGDGTGLLPTTAAGLTTGAQVFNITYPVNYIVEMNPNMRLYVELYWVTTNRLITTVTTGVTLESAGTYLQTPFFKPSMQSVDSNSPTQILNIG